ncbi:MAG: N-acetyltransferase [Hyphomonadaceae bacterium]
MNAVSPYTILQESPEHAADVEALYDDVFGPGRFAKTVERLREGNAPIPEACLVAVDDKGLTGVVRLWPVTVGDGGRAALLGPLAVAARRRGNGVAFKLMEQAIAVCAEQGYPAVVLVGDESYYTRAGFRRSEPGRFALPGPVDPKRVLVRELSAEGAGLNGLLSVPRALRL